MGSREAHGPVVHGSEIFPTMAALSEDKTADLRRRVAELERQLEAAVIERDAAVERQTESALVSFRLQNELRAAHERQNASAEILRAIASVPGDAARSLQQIAETCARLFGAPSVSIQLADNGEWTQAYRFGDSATRVRAAVPLDTIRVGGPNLPGTVVAENRQIHIPDLDDLDPAIAHWPGPPHARAAGTRTMCGTPLRREETAIGVLIIYRDRLAPFTGEELALLQGFADQAVIAIENARLFNETQAALERQTATADILKVIASSPSDVQPVFEAILARALQLCEAAFGFLTTYDGERFKFAAQQSVPPALAQHFLTGMDQPRPGDAHWRLRDGEDLIHHLDQKDEDAYRAGNPLRRAVVDLGGVRSALVVALRKSESLRGAITIYRQEVRPFSASQIELLRHFADQAVIAIENTRLFEEVQAKTRDLTEALTYQTGSANILNVIASSPTDVGPVLQAIVDSACELCEAYDAVVMLKDGDDLRFSAHHGPIPVSFATHPINRNWTAGRAFVDKKAVHVHDLQAEFDEFPDGQELAARMGHRSIVSVPLLREGESIGSLVLRRTEVNPFSEKQIALLQTFADQAVIAIGNVQLFDEVQARTRELSESLQQQTATADVLKVISRSAFDLQPVLETLIRSAVELSGAGRGALFLRDGELLRYRAASHANQYPDWIKFLQHNPQRAGRHSAIARAIASAQTVSVPDVLTDPEIKLPATTLANIRAVMAVPLLRDGKVEGMMALSRPTPGPFTDRQIELVQTFADQAVIAIENARLFDEVQAKTRDLQESLQQQTATADVLKVISRSTFDLPAVLHALVETAARLCGADQGTITRQKDGTFYRAESHGFSDEFMNYVRSAPVAIDYRSATGRALLEGAVVHIPDVETDRDYNFQEGQRLGGFRSLLGVPMLRQGVPIGVITLTRTEPRGFSDKQIELAITFADQAVIAIENVRLFDEVQARTRELAKSLDELRTAQDRLIQTEKLASLGQLTAGIAHEIKNPLNFVNNFAALSAELTDELKDALKPAALDESLRAEVDELTSTLKDNLGKVVQHGKRADSIVKNMLLHSREGSGDHRPADINALVDESLNLAYHGARAEKPHFNVTLQRNFDPEAGMIEVFPQEITRVFLNLISNGFYAVAKRKADNGGSDFEPVMSATTKGRTDHVEIRIRDNGTGIPADVKEKMFNPFFTTKPAGEGTGLGLSMSHDIIVKQHGGTIEVDTLQGEFTEFTIVLPRTSNLSNNSRG